MKKFYLLSILCFLSLVTIAQTSAVLIPPGVAGSKKTGNVTPTTFTDDIIFTTDGTPTTTYGYAVFDLSAIPATATIQSATFGYYVNAVGAGTPAGCNIYGYVGDLSVLPSAGVFPAISSVVIPSTELATLGAGYGAVGTQAVSNTTLRNFVNTNRAGKVSICLTGGGFVTYDITGESGTTLSAPLPVSLPANHVPYLQVRYCSVPTITVTPTPNPVCVGSTITFTNTVTGVDPASTGPGTYSWRGPAAFFAAGVTPSFTASAAADGTYTVTITNNCASAAPIVTNTVSATFTITVNPVPAAITGASVICRPGSTALSDVTALGTWSVANTNIALVNTTGTVTANTMQGLTTVSYTLPTGCYATKAFRVNDPPAAITGPVNVCQGATITLGESVPLGTWSSGTTLIALVSSGGVVTGNLTAGTSSISYTIAGCTPAMKTVTVHPTPSGITGGSNVCMNSPVTFSDAMGGGTWSTANTTVVEFGVPPLRPADELKALAAPSSATITYTTPAPASCTTTLLINVDPAVAAITGGATTICQHLGTTMTDVTPGGFWSTGSTTISVVPSLPSTGDVVGLAGGIGLVTYNYGACQVTRAVTVTPAPLPITGPGIVCQNDSFYLSDATTGARWTSSNTTITIDSVTGFVRAGGETETSGIPVTFYYKFTGGTCYDSLNTIVNKAPVTSMLIAGPTTFCTGGSVTLTAIPGAATYTWYSNSVPFTTTPPNVYTTSSTETITVRIVNAAGCVGVTAPILVISGISPTIDYTGNDTFCEGGHALLTANSHGTVGTISYQWRVDGVNIVGAITPNYYATKPGDYLCRVTVEGTSGSCAVLTSDVLLVVNPAPEPPISYSAKNLFTSNTFATYQWYLNNVGVPGATKSTFVPKENGKYKVVVTNAIGCTGYSSEIVIKTLAVENINKPDVKIYPNPATSVLHIESPVNVKAMITGIEGKVVLTENNAKDMDISRLASGMYLVMLFDENGDRIAVQKLIKE